MVVHLMLKQANRSVVVDKEVLLQELALALKQGRKSDAYVLTQKLQEMGWDLPQADSDGSVTPEMARDLEKDQYWALVKVLDKINPPRLKKATGTGRSGVVIGAQLQKLVGELFLLIDRLKNATRRRTASLPTTNSGPATPIA